MANEDNATVAAVSGVNVLSGRNEDIWGNRRVGLYRVTLGTSAPTTGYSFDPRAFGFQGPVAAVFISPHIVTANAALMRYLFFYDAASKKIVPADITDTFDAAGADDLSSVVLDVLVIGE